jgi:hypothetical protein
VWETVWVRRVVRGAGRGWGEVVLRHERLAMGSGLGNALECVN